MSGPKPDYPISLTEAEGKNLEQLVRAQILLNANAHPEWSNQQIAKLARTSDRIVRKWRERWVSAHSIADAPRSGAPRRFSPSRPCASHGHGVQFATAERGAADSLESCRASSADGSQHARAKSSL